MPGAAEAVALPVGAALLALLVAGALVAGASAETPSRPYQSALDRTVRFLQEDQNMDGGFGGEAGSPSDPDISSWVALALAATGVNPHDQKQPGGVDVYSYLAAHAKELTLTTDFERALLVVDASEYPPQPFGGINLVEAILASRLPNGAFSHEAGGATPGMNDTIFAILALSPIKEPEIEAVVHEAAEWVIAEQNADHSWPSWCPKTVAGCSHGGKDPQDSTDMTGAALEALNAAGMHGTEAQAKALEYLYEAQLPDGGWPQALGETESNVGSTAWVVQGIWAAGGNPETWVEGGKEPLGYLASMQQADGHIRYMKSQELNGVWMTSYATPAFAGEALPIPVVPRSVVTEPTRTSTEGVTAGGGGNGAPLFSRPKPQSKGQTPGGARIVRGEGLRARDHSKTRRGANQHQARGTEKTESTHTPEADQETGSVSHEAQTASAAIPSASTATQASGGSDHGGNRPDGSHRIQAPRMGDVGGEGTGPNTSLPVGDSSRRGTTTGEEVSGVVIGSPEGGHGKVAFGAPGLRSANAASDGLGTAIGIGVAALLAAGFGIGWERRRGRLA